MSQVTREDQAEQSGWAIGGMVFAASAMLIIGCWQAIMGLAAIIDDDFYVVTANYTFDLDTTAWGWVHLIVGVLVALAGLALFAGQTWAADRGGGAGGAQRGGQLLLHSLLPVLVAAHHRAGHLGHLGADAARRASRPALSRGATTDHAGAGARGLRAGRRVA